ncbi:hypothetical protein CT0861_05062 [Colletotrichum tofieldiae]|uniref:J domain-containing protein n=1 Tax=Colletotrichum tofieldiae TaxID=708197 RepID=A0A166MD22_9PEZI|nr:hypothetical protein CT0861_05062 [Colletotrichum tofieldiae]
MLFSPFDALGLTWGKYDATGIKKAYRRAALVCHPDKRERNGIQPHRWPQMWQLEEAKDYLLKAESEELKKFEGFPQTFFQLNDKSPYFQIPQPLPGHFKHCDICEVVVLSDDFTKHLEEHQKTICPECDEREQLDDIADHLTKLHDYRTCHHCQTLRAPTEHNDHIKNYHQCPLCDMDQAFIINHLEEAHRLIVCNDCGSDNPVTHVITAHPATECTGCNNIIFDEFLLYHLQEDHGLTPCDTCDVWDTAIELRDHVLTGHGLDRCLLCTAFFEGSYLLDAHLAQVHDIRTSKGDLNLHVIESHGWLQCRFCDDGFPDEALRTSHEEHAHDTQPCWHCDQEIPESQMRSHQIQEHGYKGCPFCPSLSRDLTSHIQRHKQESATMHHQLSAIHDKLRQFAAIEPRSKALLYQAAEYIQQAFDVEIQDPVLNHQGLASLQAAQLNQTQCGASISAQERRPPSRDEAGERFQTSIAKVSSGQGSGEESSQRRSGRQQRKRTSSYSLGSVKPSRKKPRTSVTKQTSLEDVLEKVTSKETVRSFVEAVRSNNHLLDPPRVEELCHASQSAYGSLSLISQFADKCEREAGRAKMGYYYALLQMAQLLDRTKKESGRQRVDSAELDKILEHKQCEFTDHNRNRLRNQLQFGRKLQRISGPFVGLLCFLAIGQADVGKNLSLTEADLERFHARLRTHEKLWAAGEQYLRLWHTGAVQGAHEFREITGLIDDK